MFEFILSRLHPRPERRGFTLHMDKIPAKHCLAINQALEKVIL
jgi:hypothetical protein